jgi:hypothetical protein
MRPAESRLEDGPFTLVGVVGDEQHEAICSLQALLDRVEPVLACFDLHFVQKDVDLIAPEPFETFPEQLRDFSMLRALVAEEDSKLTRYSVERLLRGLNQDLGLSRPWLLRPSTQSRSRSA